MSEDVISKELKKQIGELLEAAREDFRNIEGTKKERLLRLAKEIEQLGYPKHMICETILKVYAGEEGLSKSTIEKTLPEEYKRKYEKNDNCVIVTQVDDKKVIVQSSTGTQQVTESNDIYKDDKAVPLEHQIKQKDQEIEQLKKDKDFETQRYVKLYSTVQQPKPVPVQEVKILVDINSMNSFRRVIDTKNPYANGKLKNGIVTVY